MIQTLDVRPGTFISAQDVLDVIEAERDRHLHHRQDDDGNWTVPDEKATRECYGCNGARYALDAIARQIKQAGLMPSVPHPADREPSRPCCDVCTP